METITVTVRKGQFYLGNPESAEHSAGSTAALCKLLLDQKLATPDTPIHCVTDTGTVIWKSDYPISHFLQPLKPEPKKEKTMTIKTKTQQPEGGDLTPVASSEPVVLKTKMVWAIADEMPNATRAEVVSECVKRGINKSTASVQFGLWAKSKAAG